MKPACLLPLVACLIINPFSAAAQEADLQWPQWRGPRRDGQLAGKPWPATLDRDTIAEQWRVKLEGPSFSGPIVAGERVFVTLTRDEKTEHVIALDRTTGRKLWETSWEGAMEVEPIGASAIAADQVVQPATEPDAGDGVAKVPGDMLWKNFLQGYMSSPIIIGDHAYIHLRNERLACVNLADGKRTWTSKPLSVYLSRA